MSKYVQQRHKPPAPLDRPRELIVVCPALRSKVNLSRIVRAAGCFGVRKIIVERPFAIDMEIARNAAEYVEVEPRRTLIPVLKRLKSDGYAVVGLEQASGATCLYETKFPRRTALLLGHERAGIPEQQLQFCDQAVEIPVHGQPASLNVATAAAVAIYEYCRQFPEG